MLRLNQDKAGFVEATAVPNAKLRGKAAQSHSLTSLAGSSEPLRGIVSRLVAYQLIL
jgi:hypothetical protein